MQTSNIDGVNMERKQVAVLLSDYNRTLCPTTMKDNSSSILEAEYQYALFRCTKNSNYTI
jgi:hypothetical protein